MALVNTTYLYTSHADDVSIYLSRLTDIADAVVAAVPAKWTRTHAALYQTDYALVILTHADGAQLALVCGTGTAPFDGSPYNNRYPHSDDGDDDRLYISWKPKSSVSTFNTANDPKTDTAWCSDAGAYPFYQVQIVDLRIANRRFNFLLDDTHAKIMMEYQDTTGTPGNSTSSLLLSDSGTGTMFRSGTMKSFDNYGDFVLLWTNSTLARSTMAYGQTKDENNSLVQIGTTSSISFNARITADEYTNSATYNPTQPWVWSEAAISVAGLGVKGKIDNALLRFIRNGAIASKKHIGGAAGSCTYIHLDEGQCWFWNQTAWGNML